MADANNLDRVRVALRKALDNNPAFDMASLSRKIGRNPAYIQQFLERHTPRELKESDRLAIVSALKLPENALRAEWSIQPDGETTSHEMQSTGRSQGVAGAVTIKTGSEPPQAWPRDLPIRGFVKGGHSGFFLDNGEPMGHARRPPHLQGINGAYAVYVHDESMSPRYESGELVYVNPLRPARSGDHVVLQLVDGQAFIKKLTRRTQKIVECEQYNPRRSVEYDAAKVATIHVVVLSGEDQR